MKIAMLGVKAVPAIGGIAQYVEQVGARLVERGHDVTVYCRPHYLEGNGSYRGMRRVVTRGIQGKHLDALTHTATAALHASRCHYDIVHIHGSAPGVFAALPRVLGREKTVVTVHGLDWQGAKWTRAASALMRTAARVTAHSAHRMVAVSEWVQHEYTRAVACEMATIPTGVEPAEPIEAKEILEHGLAPEGYIFCASRLMPEKGLHHLVAAFESLDTEKKLVIAGNAPYDDEYTRALLSHASDRIIFLGFVQGRLLKELYSNAYLYVQPSELEGMSIAILEALSYGRCVLASDIPQNREALGSCGYVFRSKDVADLEQSLRGLLDHPALVSEQCDLARTHVRTYRSWDTTAERYETLYDDLLAGRFATYADAASPSVPEAREGRRCVA